MSDQRPDPASPRTPAGAPGQGPHDPQVRPHGGGPDERRYVPSDVSPGRWVRRAVVLLAAVALAYAAYRISLAFFPRWWAQRVADQVNGDLTSGVTWGLFYGFVFTFVPLILLVQVRRRFFSWFWRGVVVVVAVLLAAPNWLTLSIVAGSSNAAHAGERILDVDGPGFRWASAIGAGGAAVLVVVLLVAGIALGRRRRQVKDLKGELRARDERERAAGPGAPGRQDTVE